MLRAALKSLLARKLRLLLSGFAVVLGVAFVAGSLIFTDTLERSFAEIFDQTTPDVVVRPETTSAAAGSFTGADARTVPGDLVGALEEVTGVARADGNVSSQGVYVVGEDGRVVGATGAPGIAVNWNDAPAADGSQAVTVVEGRVPERPGEVAIDLKTAASAGYAVGDSVSLVSTGEQPQLSAELVGTVRFGSTGNLVGATLTVFETAAAQDLFLGGADAFTDISVTTEDQASAAEVAASVAAVLPEGIESRVGEDVAEENQTALQEGLGFFNTFLLVFAAVALVVGTFLILNTFTILVAQRTRELALFRALGASRRQVTRSVLLEALVTGLLASTTGLLLGFGLAQGLKVLFGTIGLDLGQAGLVFRPQTALAAYVVGVVVTLIAAYVPARHAARVPPVAAMRDDVSMPTGSLHRRFVAGVALAGVGALGMALGLAGTGSGSTPALLVGLGVLGVFLGTAVLAPVIGPPVVRVLAAPYPRLFGPTGRLARENAQRNPRRTAATASALMIGLALVTAMSVLGASTSDSVDRLVDDGLEADYVVSNAVQVPFSTSVARDLAEVDGVDEVAAYRVGFGQVGGEDTFLAAFDPAPMLRAVTVETVAGDIEALDERTVLLSDERATAEGLAVGDTVELTLPAGTQELEVAGTYSSNQFIGAGVVVAPETLEAGGVAPADNLVYVTRTADADPEAVTGALEQALAGLPTVTLKDQDAFADEQRAPVDQLLAIVYALLGLAIVIAALGIVNTLALSVIERTREVGLLRAVGMSRRQLRTMVRLEAVAIALLGALLGLVLGLVFGVSLQRAIADQGVEVLTVPWVQLVAFFLAAGLVGVLAAVWPARRAARLDVLRAITTE
ncbi:MAG TPA: FtsX-like permease family protein [Jiangellales bacterium]|nr:FtsX-like permease family protein [Jiangellales bacterium]